jgi:Flp pilus assembly protein TadG
LEHGAPADIRGAVKNRIMFLRREDGQAVVELALVIPLLLFVLFAIIDFGEALNQVNDTTNLANLGVRAAVVAVNPASSPPACGASTTMTSYLQCEGAFDAAALGPGQLKVCVTDSSGSTWAQGDTIVLKATDTFNWFQLMVGGVGKLGGVVSGPATTISSTATMREEAAGNTSEPPWVSTGATAWPC